MLVKRRTPKGEIDMDINDPGRVVEEQPEVEVLNSDADVSELCVALKDHITKNIRAGMQTHEVQDVLGDIMLAIDTIDASARAAQTRT